MTRAEVLARYVRATRNPKKRAYAAQYVAWKLGEAIEPDSAASGLSYMGAQSVRLSVARILATGTS